MTLERIAVATAVISATVSAGGLLLTWYRGSARQRPALARTLGGLAIASAVGLIVALALADGENGSAESNAARGAQSAHEYRAALIRVCQAHVLDANRIERAGGRHQSYDAVILLESRAIDRLRTLRPPSLLAPDHERILALWEQRLSLLSAYYERVRREGNDPGFQREFARATKQADALGRALQRRFDALGLARDCDLFT